MKTACANFRDMQSRSPQYEEAKNISCGESSSGITFQVILYLLHKNGYEWEAIVLGGIYINPNIYGFIVRKGEWMYPIRYYNNMYWNLDPDLGSPRVIVDLVNHLQPVMHTHEVYMITRNTPKINTAKTLFYAAHYPIVGCFNNLVGGKVN